MLSANCKRVTNLSWGLFLVAAAFSIPGESNAAGKPFCEKYATSTSAFVTKALKKQPGCIDYSKGVHADYNMHFNWCLQNPRKTVSGAARHIRDLANACTGSAAKPKAKKQAQNKQVDLSDRGCPMVAFSLPSEVPATIHFANSTFRTVRIFWVDFKGNRKLYKTLKHGESYVQPSYAKHMWLAVDESGACVDGPYIAKPNDNIAEFFGD